MGDGSVAGVARSPRVLRPYVAILAFGLAMRVAHILWKYDVDWEPDDFQHILVAQSVFAALPYSLWYAIHVWAKRSTRSSSRVHTGRPSTC